MTDVHLLHSLPESFLGTFCCIARKRTFSFSHMSRDEIAQSMPWPENEGEAKEEGDEIESKVIFHICPKEYAKNSFYHQPQSRHRSQGHC